MVDLSDLTFADSSMVFDLAVLAQRMRQSGCSVKLYGAQPHIARLIELVGLDRQPGVVLSA